MVAKTPSKSKKAKAAAGLKPPKTPKADKVGIQTKKILGAEDRLKVGLDEALVLKAVKALIKFNEKQNAEKMDLLGGDQQIQVQITLLNTPEKPSRKPMRIMIPHPLFQVKDAEAGNQEEPEVCLIVKEESKPWVQEMIEKFPEHMGCIKKVMGLQSLRTKHARYEQRRALLNKYNVFMADDRILPMLSKALGSDFYKAKKLPIPITLTRKEALPFAIQKALTATYMSIATGTCISIRGGVASMTPEQLTENILAIAQEAVPKLPRKWANVQNISIKTPESVALPIYNKTPEVLQEIAAAAGIKTPRQNIEKIDTPEKEKEPKPLAETPKSEKKRDLKSPLLRALKKQKQEEKESKEDDAQKTPMEKTRRSTSEDSASKKLKSVKKDKADKEVETPKSQKKGKVKDQTEEKAETPKSQKKGKNKDQTEEKAKKKAETPKSQKKGKGKDQTEEKAATPKSQKKGENKDQTEEKAEKKVETPKSQKKRKGDDQMEETPNSSKQKGGDKKTFETPKSNGKKLKKDESASQDNAAKDFAASKKFNGARQGYAYRMGKQGLGYYVDKKPKVDRMAMDALVRSASKAKGKGGKAVGQKKGKGRRRSY